MTYTPTEMSRGDIESVVRALQEERTHRLDLIAPSSAITPVNGKVTVALPEPQLTDYGVISYLTIDPSDIMIGQMADKLDVPVKYLRQVYADTREFRAGTHTSAAVALDHIIGNGLDTHPRSSYMLRTFVSEGGEAYGRAWLSDRYDASLDSLDYLMTMLDALKEVAPNAQIANVDVTEKAMRVRVFDPSVATLAPTLLRGYRSPYGGATGDENPTVFAGFEAGTSDVGQGSRYLVPRLIVQICNNGMKMTKDAIAKKHLGGRHDEGIVQWSDETSRRNLELVRSEVRDIVHTVMDVEYMERKIEELNELAGIPVAAPQAALVGIGKQFRFTDTEVDGILSHFISGGQTTAGGVMQAITSYAQTVDGDRQAELEDVAVEAMSMLVSA